MELLLSKGSKVVSDNAGVSTLELCAQVCDRDVVTMCALNINVVVGESVVRKSKRQYGDSL